MTSLKHTALGFFTAPLLLLVPALGLAQPEEAAAPPAKPALGAAAAPATDAAEPPASTEATTLDPAAVDSPTQDSSKPKYSYEDGGLAKVGLVTGLKLGGGLGIGAFGATPLAELELGYLLPPLKRSLEVFVSGQYAGPKAKGDNIEDDYALDEGSRLPGTASYEIVERQAVLSLGVLYRVPLDLPLIRPYGSLGGRLYLTEAVIDASAGDEAFGENRETDMQPGFFAALGAEAYIGPGAALFELQLGYAKIDGYVLRNAKATSLNATLGYRLFI